jgi:hypothetical protein
MVTPVLQHARRPREGGLRRNPWKIHRPFEHERCGCPVLDEHPGDTAVCVDHPFSERYARARGKRRVRHCMGSTPTTGTPAWRKPLSAG